MTRLSSVLFWTKRICALVAFLSLIAALTYMVYAAIVFLLLGIDLRPFLAFPFAALVTCLVFGKSLPVIEGVLDRLTGTTKQTWRR